MMEQQLRKVLGINEALSKAVYLSNHDEIKAANGMLGNVDTKYA